MDTAELVRTLYRILVVESLIPASPARVVDAALAAAGRAGAPRPAHLGADADADSSWLADATKESRAPWDIADAMVRAADDPHTILNPPAMGMRMMAMVTGRPSLLPGFRLHRTGGAFVVGEVVPESTAEGAGLRAGDLVATLAGEPVERGMEDLLRLNRRADGETIEVRGTRAGAPLALSLTLREARLPVAESRELGAGIGYVRLRSVATSDDPEGDSAEGVRRGVTALAESGMRALVLDLRSNPGGYGVTRVGSVLTSGDPIIRYVSRTGEEELGSRRGAAAPFDGPIAVLVDEQTLSAAEMISLCLREHRGARLVGVPTGGGLNVPRQVPLGDSYLLMVPERRAAGPVSRETPKGMRLVPDVHVPNPAPDDYAAGRDPQLDAAVALLAS